MSSRRRQRLRKAFGAVAAALFVAGVAYFGGPDTHWPGSLGSDPVLLWFEASRDLGVLPARDSWCITARTAEHCWVLQQGSGDATDYGSGNWHLSPQGTPRAAIVSGLPVSGTTVDISSELAVGLDGAGYLTEASPIQPATDKVSVTMVVLATDDGYLWSHRDTMPGDGYSLYLSSGVSTMLVDGATGSTTAAGTADLRDNAWHCVTAVFDGSGADLARVYVDGEDDTSASKDLSGQGSWGSIGPAMLGADQDGANMHYGMIARARVDYAALTKAQHRSLCGTLWLAPSNGATQVADADTSWTQSGGARCFARGANSAICVPGGLPGYIYDSALASPSIAWPLEPSRINRVPYSAKIDCTNWTCAGSATATYGKLAPDGSLTATEFTVGSAANGLKSNYPSPFYSASMSLYPKLWLKCSSGSFYIVHRAAAAYGYWSIDCAVASGGSWVEIHSASQAGVTLGNAWVSTAIGDGGFWFYSTTSATAQIWNPTLTEVPGYSVIPTWGSAEDTGTISWQIDNDPAQYYLGAKGKLTLYGYYDSGACFDVYNGATNVGRSYWVADEWHTYDASPTQVADCDVALSGADTWVWRWNASTALVEGLLNDVAQTCDATPSAAWTAASPSIIHLDNSDSTSCTAKVVRVKIEAVP